jgi:hypothetical protein
MSGAERAVVLLGFLGGQCRVTLPRGDVEIV